MSVYARVRPALTVSQLVGPYLRVLTIHHRTHGKRQIASLLAPLSWKVVGADGHGVDPLVTGCCYRVEQLPVEARGGWTGDLGMCMLQRGTSKLLPFEFKIYFGHFERTRGPI